jgi:hypothetical protein
MNSDRFHNEDESGDDLVLYFHPTVGEMRWSEDSECWHGKIRLPIFAQYHCQDWSDPETDSPTNTHAERGLEEEFELTIGQSDCEPTDSELQAVAELVADEATILGRLLMKIVDIYSEWPEFRLDGSIVEVEDSIRVDSTKDLVNKLQLESIHVCESPDDFIVRVTYFFYSTLDIEHGIELTTIDGEVEHDFEPSIPFPFKLPEKIDISEIQYEPSGLKLIELLYEQRWYGVFVVDHENRCLGTIQGSAVRLIPDLSKIEDARKTTPFRRWYLSPGRTKLLSRLSLLNLLVALPSLLVGWLHTPVLLWIALTVSLLRIVANLFLGDRGLRISSLALPIAAVAGIVYAARSDHFGDPAHIQSVSNVFERIVWGAAFAIAALGLFSSFLLWVTLDRSELRDGGLKSLAVSTAFTMAMILGLFTTTVGGWSKYHLLWFTPVLILAAVLFGFSLLIPLSNSNQQESHESP